jgi:maleamate amidohydrolase
MSAHPSRDMDLDPDLAIYKAQGMGQSVGLGQAPALLIVDFVNGFTDPAHFGGGNILDAVRATVPMLAHARARGWPVAHTRVIYADDGSDAGSFIKKAPGLLKLTEDNPLSQIVDALQPLPGELVVRKRQPSAFFATELAGWLAWRRVDTVLVAGCTTSGCVRASVVDAMSSNFRTIVLTDCVGDRAIGPHEANLFDMGQKYADLIDSAAIREATGGGA